MVFRILSDEYYTGVFEYPKGSGNHYRGTYEPLIDRETFDKAREKLKVPSKGKWGRKVFPFARLLTCGTCGSCVCGEEKTNRHGTTYIYYRCTRYGGKNSCDEKVVRDDRILQSFIDASETMRGISLAYDSKDML